MNTVQVPPASAVSARAAADTPTRGLMRQLNLESQAMETDPIELVKGIVRNALLASSFAEFMQVLSEAGSGFAVEDSNAVLIPKHGRRIRLARLGLDREFWLAYIRWPDGLDPRMRAHGSKVLPKVWCGLTGRALDSRSRRRVRTMEWKCGPIHVAQAMAVAVEDGGDISFEQQFARFAEVCNPPEEGSRTRTQHAPAGQGATEPVPQAVAAEAVLLPPCAAPQAVTADVVLPPPPADQSAGVQGSAGPGLTVAEWMLSAMGCRPDLGAVIEEALRRPMNSCFEAKLESQGYVVTVSGSECYVYPVKGAFSVPLSWFTGLLPEYWMRACEWPDGLDAQSLDTPVLALANMWRGLFGSPADEGAMHSIRQALRSLPMRDVAEAMYSTCWRKPGADADYRLRYFSAVWRSRESGLTTGKSHAPRRLAAYPMPRDARRRFSQWPVIPQQPASPARVSL